MDFLARLSNAFPPDTYANTLRALKEGVASADDAIKGIPLLNNPIGKDYRGLLRRAGIICRFEAMCKAGDLPFKCAITPMPKGTWHWLDIHSAKVVGHLVRTAEPDAFPEDTPNRQDQRARNQLDLFEDKKVTRISNLKLYAWLCYRALPDGMIAHAFWNMPSAKTEGKPDEWLARINLMNLVIPKRDEDDVRRPGKVDPKTLMKLKEQAHLISAKEKD